MRSTRLLAVASVVALVAVPIACLQLTGVSGFEVFDDAGIDSRIDTGTEVMDTAPEIAPEADVAEAEVEVGPSTLSITPGSTLLTIDTSSGTPVPATQTFKVTVTASDGTTKDVSSTATFALSDATVGSFTGATFTTVAGLPKGVSAYVTVTASAGGLTASTGISIVQYRVGTDFFFQLPKGKSAAPSVIPSNSKIGQIDIALVMDTTGSMGGAITNVKTNLDTTLFPNIAKIIPDVGLAIVDHRDYPVPPYGTAPPSADWPVKVLQTVTTDVALAKTAAGLYAAGGGFDGPESQIPAMQHVLTGEQISWQATVGGPILFVPAHSPGKPRWGGVDFRPGSLPVVVLVTDVDWHGEGHVPYAFPPAPAAPAVMTPATPTMASLKARFASSLARFVDITNSGAPEDQANELSIASTSFVPPEAFGGKCGTASPCCTGVASAGRAATGPGGSCLLNFLHSGGTGVSESIVNAIRAMSNGLTFTLGIGAFAVNDPGNPVGIDATKFFSVRAMNEGSATCIALSAKDTNTDTVLDTFNGPVRLDQKICFEMTAKNDAVDAKPEPQFVLGYIDIIGTPGNVKLERRTVLIMVPAS